MCNHYAAYATAVKEHEQQITDLMQDSIGNSFGRPRDTLQPSRKTGRMWWTAYQWNLLMRTAKMADEFNAEMQSRFLKAANQIASATKQFVVATEVTDTTYTSAEDENNPYIRIPVAAYCLKMARDLWRDIYYPPTDPSIGDPMYNDDEVELTSQEVISAVMRTCAQLTPEDRLTLRNELAALETMDASAKIDDESCA